MSHEIREDNGTYGLCIFNAENTPDDELQDIFGSFGPLLRLHRSGNLTFIKYGTREEAVTCFEEMQNDQRFKVRPAKKKGNPDFRSSKENLNDEDQRNMKRNNDRGNFNQKPNETRRQRPMPKLMTVLPPEEEGPPNAPPTKTVIIGNLHAQLKQCNIYDLAKSAMGSFPLHVAMKRMNRPNYPTIHYAQVFVKTDADVKKLVDGLNRFVLNGRPLVVSPADTLIEVGKSLK